MHVSRRKSHMLSEKIEKLEQENNRLKECLLIHEIKTATKRMVDETSDKDTLIKLYTTAKYVR